MQYQNWPDHLQKFDATLAANTAPDVIEMGNTEMTKYMAAGAFADLSAKKSSFANSANWLKGLAASGVFNGKTYGVPYYAGSRVVTYRTDLFKKAGIKKPPTLARRVHARPRGSSPRRTSRRPSPRSTSRAPTGTSRWASSTTSAAGSRRSRTASGSARSTASRRSRASPRSRTSSSPPRVRARRRSRRSRTRTTSTPRAARRR